MNGQSQTGTDTVKRGLAQMLKGGVIMDVVTPEQAKIAEEAGAVAVMALERIPADIRADGGVARMSHPALIERIMKAVSIPVMAKVRIGHIGEARQLQALGVDYIDESEVLTPADDKYHVEKQTFKVPFVCGARDLGEALRRIAEGAAMIRSKGEAGSGNIVEAVRHMRAIRDGIATLAAVARRRARRAGARPGRAAGARPRRRDEPQAAGRSVLRRRRLDAGRRGVDDGAGRRGIFVGSGIFKSTGPAAFARAIVDATTHWQDADVVLRAHTSIPEDAKAMAGLDIRQLHESQLLATRGN